MDISVRDNFKKLVYSFFRDNDLSSHDMSMLLRSAFEFFVTDYDKEKNKTLDLRSKLSQKSVDDFEKMWESFVQQSIDFVREHIDVKSLIESERQELTEEWNQGLKDSDYKMIPDLRLYFGVDGLDESVNEGKWVSATDSGITLKIGNREIIDMA